jgi:hypothetical protein
MRLGRTCALLWIAVVTSMCFSLGSTLGACNNKCKQVQVRKILNSTCTEYIPFKAMESNTVFVVDGSGRLLGDMLPYDARVCESCTDLCAGSGGAVHEASTRQACGERSTFDGRDKCEMTEQSSSTVFARRARGRSTRKPVRRGTSLFLPRLSWGLLSPVVISAAAVAGSPGA